MQKKRKRTSTWARFWLRRWNSTKQTKISIQGLTEEKMKRIAVNSKLLVTKFFDMTRIRIGLIGQLRSTFPHFTMCTISIHFNSFTIQIHRTKSFTMLQIIRSQALKALIIQTAIIKTCFCMSTSTRISKLIINIIFCSTHKIKNYFFTINQTTN